MLVPTFYCLMDMYPRPMSLCGGNVWQVETSRGGCGGCLSPLSPHSSLVGISANFILDPAMEKKNKKSLAQEVRQKNDISERRSKG